MKMLKNMAVLIAVTTGTIAIGSAFAHAAFGGSAWVFLWAGCFAVMIAACLNR